MHMIDSSLYLTFYLCVAVVFTQTPQASVVSHEICRGTCTYGLVLLILRNSVPSQVTDFPFVLLSDFFVLGF